MTLHSIRHRLAVLLFCLTAMPWSAPLAGAELSRKDFATPPLQARPGVLWTWLNGHVDRQQITRELEEMKAKGLRGAIIWDMGSIADPDKLIAEGPEFLGPESLKSIHHAIDEAGRLGLELGLIASSSWNAGGPWVDPVDASKKLTWSETLIEGGRDIDQQLALPEKTLGPYRDVALLAIPFTDSKSAVAQPSVVRIDACMDSQGRLVWKAPAGKWRVLRFIQDNTGQKLMCPSPKSSGLLVDHLSAPAAEAHTEHVLDVLIRGRKDYGSLKSLMLDSYEVKAALDWTPDFTAQFSRRMGYDPIPWLPVLAGQTIGDNDRSARFRHDYGVVVSDLIIENHYVRIRELANRRGLILLSEAGHGGHARVDPLKALGAADVPMGEYWNYRKNWVTKEAASAANLYGKTLVNCESMTGWRNWQDGPAVYKRITDIALCAGLNQITFHTFAHNPPAAGLPGNAYHAGEHFNLNLTWWNQATPMLAALARSSHMLQQGRFVADVCAYYGDDAPNLVPARRIDPRDKPQYGEGTCLHCGRPLPVDLRSLGQNHDYDFLNEEMLVEHMVWRDGRLRLPSGMEYRLLVLPARESISLAALQKIAQLVKAGATVVGPRPQRSNSLVGYPACDEQVRKLAAELWGDCDGKKILSHDYGKGRVIWNRPLADVLADMNVAPDFVVEDRENPDRGIDYIHRRTDDADIYFIANTTTSPQHFTARFRVDPARTPSFWNPETGEVTPCLRHDVIKDAIRVPLELAPATSKLVVFEKTAQRPEHLVELQREQAGKLTRDPSGCRISGMTGDQLNLQTAEPGTYQIKTSTGRNGRTTIDALPAPHPVDGPWRLEFQKDRGAPPSIELPQLIDWTQHADPAVRYFSGTGTYQHSFTLPAAMLEARAKGSRILLDLGQLSETAEVSINGKAAGLLWKPPFRLDVTDHIRAGENRLSIAVTNLWYNRLIGDAQAKDDVDITRTNLHTKFQPNSPLIPSGIIGPVRFEVEAVATMALTR